MPPHPEGAAIDSAAACSDPGLAALVEPFDRAATTSNMTVAENLLFGTPRGACIPRRPDHGNAYVRRCWKAQDLMLP